MCSIDVTLEESWANCVRRGEPESHSGMLDITMLNLQSPLNFDGETNLVFGIELVFDLSITEITVDVFIRSLAWEETTGDSLSFVWSFFTVFWRLVFVLLVQLINITHTNLASDLVIRLKQGTDKPAHCL